MDAALQDPFFNHSNDLENNFCISLLSDDFPIEFSPIRINSCLVCVCLCGTAEIEIDLRSYPMGKNDIIVVFPGQILACTAKSSDFAVCYFSFSHQLVDEILYRFPSTFIGFLTENVIYPLPEAEREAMFNEYFLILDLKFRDRSNVCRRDILLNLLHNFYLDLYNNVIRLNRIHTRQRKRKQELLEEFFRLVGIHTDKREVAFFANQLCITPKYLSIITTEIAGRSAKELIDKYAITELKLQLKASSTPLKTIAERLNYPSEAFLCKFFKRQTGMTPSRYRTGAGS